MQGKRIISLPFVIAPIICVVVFLLLSIGCANHPDQYRIGLSQCLDDAWRQKMNEEMEREVLLHPNMRISKRIANGSNELQCAQIDSFIRERIDLLIVSPFEAEAINPAVSRAYRAGIPVIVADRRVSGDEWTAFVGGDNYQVGQLMADWIRSVQKSTPHPIHVLEVSGMPGSTPEELRHRGMMERLEVLCDPMPQISIVDGSADAHAAVEAFLSEHPDVDAIVAQNDLMAVDAAEVVRDTHYHRVRIMGVDGLLEGLNAIVNGMIECTATYESRGDILIETAAQILNGEPFVRDTVLATHMVDSVLATAMLKQYHERLHDLEIFRIVRLDSETRWQQMMAGRQLLIGIIMLFGLIFVLIVCVQFYMQRKIRSEIKDEILPQLEDVQEVLQLSRRDQAFAERLRQVVDEHLTDPNLNVEYLGSMLGLSRSQVFRRVKAVTGKGPLDYIRERRLERADQLLQTTDMTVKQVAIEFCFATSSHFSRCYKDYFGHLPSSR